MTRWEDFVPALNKKCIVLTPFCNETEWEETVKKRSREEAGGDEDARTATRYGCSSHGPLYCIMGMSMILIMNDWCYWMQCGGQDPVYPFRAAPSAPRHPLLCQREGGQEMGPVGTQLLEGREGSSSIGKDGNRLM